jgi:hypothetical protein
MILSGKQLAKLKEEYARNVVEHMTRREMHCYLIQVIYNDVSVEDGDAVMKKIVQKFGQETYDRMCEEILTSTSNKPHPAIAELTCGE